MYRLSKFVCVISLLIASCSIGYYCFVLEPKKLNVELRKLDAELGELNIKEKDFEHQEKTRQGLESCLRAVKFLDSEHLFSQKPIEPGMGGLEKYQMEKAIWDRSIKELKQTCYDRYHAGLEISDWTKEVLESMAKPRKPQ